jgi:hypothetical protein
VIFESILALIDAANVPGELVDIRIAEATVIEDG